MNTASPTPAEPPSIRELVNRAWQKLPANSVWNPATRCPNTTVAYLKTKTGAIVGYHVSSPVGCWNNYYPGCAPAPTSNEVAAEAPPVQIPHYTWDHMDRLWQNHQRDEYRRILTDRDNGRATIG